MSTFRLRRKYFAGINPSGFTYTPSATPSPKTPAAMSPKATNNIGNSVTYKSGYNTGYNTGAKSVGIKQGAMNTWNRMGKMGKFGTIAAATAGTFALGKGIFGGSK